MFRAKEIVWRLTSAKRQNDYLLVMCRQLLNLSFDSRLTAYLRQKHIISNYLNIFSYYVHIIVSK